MSGLWGADPEQLRALAASLHRGGVRLNELATTLRQDLETTPWRGRDGEAFRAAWADGHQSALARCSRMLLDGARLVEGNAREQEQASNGNPGTGHPLPAHPLPGGVQAAAGTDREGDPGGGGDHVRIATPIPEADSDLQADMIRQGGIGDCWLLASLGAVARNDPGFIREHLALNEDGSYTVTFYEDGNPVEITVEASRIGNSATDPDGNPNYATIYEKAAAEYFGGDYPDIDGDDPQRALEAITGKEARTERELSFAEIHDRLDQGPVVAITESGGDWNPFTTNDGDVDNENIVANHVYVVTEIVDGRVHLINPWGPDGGLASDGNEKVGDIWLTEEEYRENFSHISSAPSPRPARER